MTTGQKIYECRKRAGMTQEELADKLGVTRQAVSKWEQDTAFPETDKVLELCKLFSVSADELLFGRDSVHKEQPLKEESIEKVVIIQPSEQKAKDVNIEEGKDSAHLKTVEEKYNLFSIFGFVAEIIAAVLMTQIIVMVLFGSFSDGAGSGRAPTIPLLVLMMTGLILSIVGLGTGKKLGRRGRGLAISAIWIFVCLFIIVAVFMIFALVLAGGFLWLIILLAGGGAGG